MLKFLKNSTSLIILALLCTPQTVHAGLVYQDATKLSTVAPQGTSEAPILGFTLSDDSDNESTVGKISIQNTAEDVQFGRGIDSARLYRDNNKNSSLDQSDTLLDETEPFTGVSPVAEFTFSNETISSSNITSYIIVYEINEFANAGSTTNIFIEKITDVENDNNSIIGTTITSSATPTTNEMVVSGIKITITDVSPEVVLPGQTDIPMLYVTMRMVGEDVNLPTDIAMSYFNVDGNYITDSNGKNGVSKVYLYNTTKPPENAVFDLATEQTDGTLVKTLTSSTFRDSSNLDFTFPPYSGPFSGFSSTGATPTENFFIVYDLGDEITVTTDTTIGAEFFSFNGTGKDSGLNVTNTDTNNFQSASSKVGGLSLVEDSLISIIPDDTFSIKTTAPMLKFRLRANHLPVTLNSLAIVNPSEANSIPFISSIDSSAGVTQVEIYEDTNGDNVFNEAVDLRVGNYDKDQLGSFTGTVQAESVEIPLIIESSPPVAGLAIPQHDEDLSYPNNNDKILFVIYHFGAGIFSEPSDSLKTASAQLGTVVGSANLTINGIVELNRIELSNITTDSPSAPSPSATITLTRTNLSIVDVVDITPDTAIQGEIKVPMLAINLSANQSFASNNIRILNEEQTFLNNNSAVSKVWIYKDENSNNTFDSSDTFVQALSQFSESNQFANLNSITMTGGDNTFLVLYDIGQEAGVGNNNIRAQLSDIQGEGENNVNLAGETPLPRQAVSTTVATKKLDTPSLNGPAENQNAQESFPAIITLTNTSAETVVITEVEPKIYLGTIDGQDITHEFDITVNSSLPATLVPGASRGFNFALIHSRDYTQGTGVLDSRVQYTYNSGGNTAEFIRYQAVSGWIPASDRTFSLVLTGADTPNPWELPSYIEEVEIITGSSRRTFVNNEALSKTDQLVITLRNLQDIQRESISIVINGTALLETQPDESTGFSFNEATREITIHELGETSGTIVLNLNDSNNNALDTANLVFDLSDNVSINRALFYPNPYRMGATDLQLGFTLTQQAKVDIHIFNHLGLEVLTQSASLGATTIGYNIITINRFNSALAPGIYACKIIAEDSLGNKAFSTARLAVY